MKKIMFHISTAVILFLTCGICIGQQSPTTDTFLVQVAEDDGYTKQYNGVTFLKSSTSLLGGGFITGWRFGNVQIPQGADIVHAALELYASSARFDHPITIRYVGESNGDAAPFENSQFEFIYRPKTVASILDDPGPWNPMGWNQSPDLQEIIQEIVNHDEWKTGNALALFAVDESSGGSRSVYMYEKGEDYAARLTITYIISRIGFDTNGDGITDINMDDRDGDGYFECPVGITDYTGTLLIDKPIEIMGEPKTRGGALLRGDHFVVTEGGEIISDQVSPVISSNYTELKGNDLVVVARNSILIEYGGKIMLQGDHLQDWDGDIFLETRRRGADIFIKEKASVYGRQIRMTSNGGHIHIRTESTIMGNSHMRFTTKGGGDIHFNRDVTVSSSSISGGGNNRITFTAEDGDLHLNRYIRIETDWYDFCGIDGNIWDDGTLTLIGKEVSCP